MNFKEVWYGAASLNALISLAKSVQVEGDWIEVGCWEGRSTVHLANAISPKMLQAVDTWEGSPGEVSEALANDGRDVYATFLENTAEFPNIVPHKMGWREYFDGNERPIAFVHIDGPHTYEEVKDNIETVLPLMVDGGVICGDDAAWEGVRQAVIDTLGDANVDAGTLWWRRIGSDVEPPGTRCSNSLAEAYERGCKIPSDINEHLHTFVTICRRLCAQDVIELGTRGGVSTVGWLFGLSDTRGRLWSVDLNSPPPTPDWVPDTWTFIQGDDLDPEVVKQLPDVVDVVFIDSSHMYDHTLAELHVYSTKVRPGGMIVLHDTNVVRPNGWTRGQPNFPVRAAVEEFCAEEGYEPHFLPNNNGLGIISIPE
jgi:predicted O-methyltransferase YrrM